MLRNGQTIVLIFISAENYAVSADQGTKSSSHSYPQQLYLGLRSLQTIYELSVEHVSEMYVMYHTFT